MRLSARLFGGKIKCIVGCVGVGILGMWATYAWELQWCGHR